MVLELYYDLYSQPSKSVYILVKLANTPLKKCVVDLATREHLTKELAETKSRIKRAPFIHDGDFKLNERELNELRKPSNDNPDILRFFRYMKAAKDGQDGVKCEKHGKCPSLTTNKPSPAMITTFNDINKLVSARKLQ